MWNPSGVLKSDACLYSSVPVIPAEVHEIVTWVLNDILDLGGFLCNDVSRSSGVPTVYEIADDLPTICYVRSFARPHAPPRPALHLRVVYRIHLMYCTVLYRQ